MSFTLVLQRTVCMYMMFTASLMTTVSLVLLSSSILYSSIH
jgi:hypothetical protein